jgi:hypothetical protein
MHRLTWFLTGVLATLLVAGGELFYIIQNGIRLTGLPGWSSAASPGPAT